MRALLIVAIIMIGLFGITGLAVLGMLIEEGKILVGKKSPVKLAEEASIAAMYRAKEAIYREAENRILQLKEGDNLDQVAMELLGMKMNHPKQVSQGAVLCKHNQPPNQCPVCFGGHK